jgi:hypothetical protein
MGSDELRQLSEVQIAFIGSETQAPNRSLRRTARGMGDEYLMQHFVDDEPEPEAEIPIGYHEIGDSDLET